MPDNRAYSISFSETTAAGRHKRACGYPTSTSNFKEKITSVLPEAKIQKFERIVGREEIRRCVSAAGKFTKVTDLDVAATVMAEIGLCAPKVTEKTATGAELDEFLGNISMKPVRLETGYIDMDRTQNRDLQALRVSHGQNQGRRMSTSALISKCRYSEYKNLNHLKTDDQFWKEKIVLRDQGLLGRSGFESRRIRSAPADFSLIVEDPPVESKVQISGDNLSYVKMGNCVEVNEKHKESSITIRSEISGLTKVKYCSPAARSDSGSSLNKSVLSFDVKESTSSSDDRSGTSDDLYHSTRSQFSQTDEGKSGLKMRRFVTQNPLKMFFSQNALARPNSSLPNIHESVPHRRFQKNLTPQRKSPKIIDRPSVTRINIFTSNDSFHEALNHPIMIPSPTTSTTTSGSSVFNQSTENICFKDAKESTTTFHQRGPNHLQNSHEIDMNGLSSIFDSKFTSVSMDAFDGLLPRRNYQISLEESLSSNPFPSINEESQQSSKNMSHEHSSNTIMNPNRNVDLSSQNYIMKSKAGIFSVKDLILEQRSDYAKTRSETILRMHSNSILSMSSETARRSLRFNNSINTANRLVNSSNISNTDISSVLQPMYHTSPYIASGGNILHPASSISSSPLLSNSRDMSMKTDTSLWMQNKIDGTDGYFNQGYQNNSSLIVTTALDRTSSTPLIESRISPLVISDFGNTSSEHNSNHNQSSHLQKSDGSGSIVEGAPDRPQLLQYLFRFESLAFQSHPLLPLLSGLVWKEFTLLHAPREVKLQLSPHPTTLSELLTEYCNKWPELKASIVAVLPRGTGSTGLSQGRTAKGQIQESRLPTLDQIMLEALASTHYSIVDMMTELRESYILTQNYVASLRGSFKIETDSQNSHENVRNPSIIGHAAQNCSRSVRNPSRVARTTDSYLENVRNSSRTYVSFQNHHGNAMNNSIIDHFAMNGLENARKDSKINPASQNGYENLNDSSRIDHPSQNRYENLNDSSRMAHPSQNCPDNLNVSLRDDYSVQQGPETVTLGLNEFTQTWSYETNTTRTAPSAFYRKLPSFV